MSPGALQVERGTLMAVVYFLLVTVWDFASFLLVGGASDRIRAGVDTIWVVLEQVRVRLTGCHKDEPTSYEQNLPTPTNYEPVSTRFGQVSTEFG